MGKIEVSWEEGGEPYNVKLRLFSGWKGEGRFNWYPANAYLIKCRLDDKSKFIYSPDGMIIGEYTRKHLRYTAEMRSIEALIKMGVTGIPEDD